MENIGDAIIGLDLANRVGICVLSAEGKKIEFRKSILLSRKDPGLRLLKLFRILIKVIKKYKPGEMAVEDIFLPARTSRKTPIALGELRGIARFAAARKNLPVFFYSPAKVKLSITGSGNASKQDVIRAISLEFGIEPRDSNEADAISIAYTHFLIRQFENFGDEKKY